MKKKMGRPMKPASEGLGVALRQYREVSGLSIRDVASVLGVSDTTLSFIERGKAVQPATAVRMFETLPLFVTKHLPYAQLPATEVQ